MKTKTLPTIEEIVHILRFQHNTIELAHPAIKDPILYYFSQMPKEQHGNFSPKRLKINKKLFKKENLTVKVL
jgi:hypothetical protein